MATWHQTQAQKRPGYRHWHPTQWTVLIDPPGEFSHGATFTTKALADVYMRNLKENNPQAERHALIIPPGGFCNFKKGS